MPAMISTCKTIIGTSLLPFFCRDCMHYVLFEFIYMFVSFYNTTICVVKQDSEVPTHVSGVRSSQPSVFWVLLCRSLIVFVSFLFWSLHFLTFVFRHLKATIHDFFLFKDFEHPSLLRIITHVNNKYPV